MFTFAFVTPNEHNKMKKTFLILTVMMLSVCSTSATSDSIRINTQIKNESIIEGKMNAVIAEVDSIQTQITSASNREFMNDDSFDWLNILIVITTLIVTFISIIIAAMSLYIAIFSLKYTKLGYKASKKTANNVQRASFNVQKGQFDDLIRHLYRNLVCTLAFTQKIVENRDPKQTQKFKPFLEESNTEKQEKYQYPSEEHLLKLKVLPEDVLHLESYNNDFTIYTKMHELKLLLRNYDIEIETAMRHLKENAQDETMIMDNLDTLTFKPLFLIYQIVEVTRLLDKKELKKRKSQLKNKDLDEYQNAFSIMTSSHIKNAINWGKTFDKKEYFDLNLKFPLNAFGEAKEEQIEKPYNGFRRSYNRLFKEVLDNKPAEDKQPIKNFVEYKRFNDEKIHDNYLTAIKEICGEDKEKQDDTESDKKIKHFRDEMSTVGNFPFKENFLTMLSIDVTIEHSKIHMIEIK